MERRSRNQGENIVAIRNQSCNQTEEQYKELCSSDFAEDLFLQHKPVCFHFFVISIYLSIGLNH